MGETSPSEISEETEGLDSSFWEEWHFLIKKEMY